MDEEYFRVPASLEDLIRHQVSGSNPDLHQAYLAAKRFHEAVSLVAQRLKPGERLSVRKLARLAEVPKSTAERWLKSEEFGKKLEQYQEGPARFGRSSEPKSDRG